MTDAMSRREIEDVLSSIRRLVSHDVAQTAPFVSARQPGPSGPSGPSGSISGEKLLLTSALRVDGPGAAPQGDDADPAGPLGAGSVKTPFVQDNDPSVGSDSPEGSPAASETQSAGRAQQDAPDHDDSVKPQLADSEPRFGPHVPSLLARISGAGQRPEAEPDLSRPLAALGRFGSGTQVVPPRPEDIGTPVAETAPKDPQATEVNAPFAPPAQGAADSKLEATLARLEELLAARVRDDTQSGVPHADADRAEDLIDEGVLYQLVAHIVRQELQGELGEKITRNIRKLVRAEVARELQLRQF